MKRVFMIFAALTVIFGFWCTSPMAQDAGERAEESGEARIERDEDSDEHAEQEGHWDEGDDDRPEGLYERLFAELERQREENRALRSEVQHLKEEIVHLLSDQIQRQQEEIHNLRMMLEHQNEFMRGLMKEEFEIRKTREVFGARWDDKNMDEMMRMRMGMGENEGNIERDIGEAEEALRRNPNDPELHTKLAHLYLEVDNPDAAMKQYKIALSIDPNFDPAFHGLEELRAKYPDISREPGPDWGGDPDMPNWIGEPEPERPFEKNAGTVVSADKRQITLKTFEGETFTFRVPLRQKDDGTWVLNEDFAGYAGSLEPGTRIAILWEEVDGGRVIRRIERIGEKEHDLEG